MPGTSVEAEQMPVGLVSAAYFEVLGLKPLMGRLFTEQENRWGGNFEVIISYLFWQTRFQGDPSVLGRTIRINDEPYAVIGVMPAGLPDRSFDSAHGRVELWTPFVPYLTANETVLDESARGGRRFRAIGRLKAGVSVEQARTDADLCGSGSSGYCFCEHGKPVGGTPGCEGGSSAGIAPRVSSFTLGES
jgi:putative ABC transport system permease protein